MNYGSPVLRKIKLVGKTDRAKKIIKFYKNSLYLMEYDEYGKPLFLAPNGLQGIYCVSPDGFWKGWFILDSEVIFENEDKIIKDLVKNMTKEYNIVKEEKKNGRKDINKKV